MTFLSRVFLLVTLATLERTLPVSGAGCLCDSGYGSNKDGKLRLEAVFNFSTVCAVAQSVSLPLSRP
jgi:hypothetical protein